MLEMVKMSVWWLRLYSIVEETREFCTQSVWMGIFI